MRAIRCCIGVISADPCFCPRAGSGLLHGVFTRSIHGTRFCSTDFAERLLRLVDNTCWLMRRTSDGGTDYVCFRGSEEPVEMLEGYYLPPQMPLIKSRRWMNRSEALSCRHRLESSEGFRHGRPLF